MKFGDFEIHTFVEAAYSLDGGLMFGVIPKIMWQKMTEVDENNLIPMVNNLYLLKAHGKNMIFDIGLGDTLSDKEKVIYNADGNTALDSGLGALGLNSDDIDYVILCHLHTDHAGGAVSFAANGKEFAPRFKNAKYIIDKKEWKAAINPNERTSAVYIPERYHALKDAGQVEFIEGNCELFPGIKAVHTGGHSEGHFALEISSGDTKVYYYGDIFPTSAHLRLPFVPATDVYPLDSLKVKREKLPEIINEKIIIAFDHDPNMNFATFKQENKKIWAEPLPETAETITNQEI